MAERELYQLTVPPDAEQSGGTEVLRAFVVDGGLSVSMQRAFDDPGTWGVLLVDLARHVARIFAKETHVSEDEALADIRRMLDAEWGTATDPGTTDAIN